MILSKKTLISTLLGAGLLGSSLSALAIVTAADLNLPPNEDISIKYTNFEFIIPSELIAPTPGSGPSNADGTYLGDNFGIFKVTTIQDGFANDFWQDGDAIGGFAAAGELTGVFWGFDIVSSTPTSSGSDIRAIGGHLALFANVDGSLSNADILAGFPSMIASGSTSYGGFDVPDYAGITGGEFLFLGDYNQGIVPLDLVTTLQGNFSATSPPTGKAAGYLDINLAAGGGLAPHLDSNAFPVNGGEFRDLLAESDFKATPPSPAGLAAAWPVSSQDPVTARTVPEPTTMSLLGLALLGAGWVSRRNKTA